MTGIRTGERGTSAPFSVYNVGSEDAITVRTIADAICQELGLDGVEYAWTGGGGGGRGGAGGGRAKEVPPARAEGGGGGAGGGRGRGGGAGRRGAGERCHPRRGSP